ncbi:type II secretion system protein GspI, partial [Acinetobacter baumannii]
QSTISPNVQKIDLQVSLYDPDKRKVQNGITHMVFFNYPVKAK